MKHTSHKVLSSAFRLFSDDKLELELRTKSKSGSCLVCALCASLWLKGYE
jgi:hypothetical protein